MKLTRRLPILSVITGAAFLSFALMTATDAVAADRVAVEATMQDEGVAVHATATIKAPFEVIWQTLTDYDHLANFIPGIEHSRVIGRRGTTAIVEQTGEAGISVFRFPISVTVESSEHRPSAITIQVVSGNLRRLTGGYSLAPVAGQPNAFVLGWNGVIEPDIPIPDFIAMPVLKSNIEDQFLAMVREIERKATLQVADYVEK